MRELEHLLPDLAPPAGGLARLRHTIATERLPIRTRRQRWVWTFAACVSAAVIAIWMPQWIIQHQRTATMLDAMSQSLSPRMPAGGIRVAHGAAIELPSGQPNVRLYLLQSLQPVARKP